MKTLKINNFEKNYSKLCSKIRRENTIKHSCHGYDQTIYITDSKKYVIDLNTHILSVSHFNYATAKTIND